MLLRRRSAEKASAVERGGEGTKGTKATKGTKGRNQIAAAGAERRVVTK